jgi:hypothetical protein
MISSVRSDEVWSQGGILCSVEGNRELFALRVGELANWLLTPATQMVTLCG